MKSQPISHAAPAAAVSPHRPLPLLLLSPLRWAPPPAVSLALQLALAPVLQPGDLDFLRGRVLQLQVDDLDLRWNLGLRGERLCVLASGLAADTRIRGGLEAFLLLAGRREDPDTLFFQRRLVVEGDTELGLQAKNLLDSLDLDALAPPLRWLLQRIGA